MSDIEAAVAAYRAPAHPTEREAARLVWSNTAALEDMAGAIAEKCGAPDQVEDECRHRDAFRAMADTCGGFAGVLPEIEALWAYVEALDGSAAVVALNVIAEAQFAHLFQSIAAEGLEPELIRAIEADETRHAAEGRRRRPPPAEVIEPVVRDLEGLIEALVSAPLFSAPLARLVGPRGLARAGLALWRAHADACAWLGIEPGLRRFRAGCIAGLACRRPSPIDVTPYQRARMTWWPTAQAASQVLRGALRYGGPRRLLFATTLRALGDALEADPARRVVHRDGRLYVAQRAVIGVRVPVGDAVGTVCVAPAGKTPPAILREMAGRTRALRRRGYEAPPDLRGLEPMLPPANTVAWAAMLDGVPGSSGHGPLIEAEGIPLSLTLGGPSGGRVHFDLVWDHRCADGAVLDGLAAEFVRRMADAEC